MKIGAVVVTFNRLNKLKLSLKKFEEQIHLPSYIIVVDNASTDGTFEYLRKWKMESCGFQKIVVTMDRNTGGSGGFHAGLEKGLDLDAEWIWVSDDDAFPQNDALKRASDYLEAQGEAEGISAICGKVIKNGKMDISHGKMYSKRGLQICETIIPAEKYLQKEFEMNTFTYVGAIMNRNKLLQAGLPNKDYFIYWDDLEHGMRMSRVGKIICIPEIVAYHNVGEEGGGINWKLYYAYRNMIDTYSKHFKGICYDYFCMKIWIKIVLNLLTGKKRIEINILQEAFSDARNQRFGLHSIYKPGWKLGE